MNTVPEGIKNKWPKHSFKANFDLTLVQNMLTGNMISLPETINNF